jgi:gamma-glutamyltranspeptidase/glutathione hydrolase
LPPAGADAYYRGPIADEIVRYSREHGGFFAAEDFARHTSEWCEPVSVNYRGYDVWELPPPGQGIAALQILNLLELLRPEGDGPRFARLLACVHRSQEGRLRRPRALLRRPALRQGAGRGLLSKDYARERARGISLDTAAQRDLPGDPPALSRMETTYLCAADSSGMMVSLIQSNYTGFGSGYVIPSLGFCLQDRGNLFDLQPGRPNSLEPGKRPFHTIIPAFVTKDGKPLMAFGLMGGDMQPQGHAQVVVNLVDFGMNLQEAGDAIRFHHTARTEPDGHL